MSVMTADVGNSTLTLNGRAIEDSPEGDVFVIAFGNDATKQTQGVNGGKVIKKTVNKDDGLLTVNVLKYSSDDTFLNNIVIAGDVTVIDGSLKTNFTRDNVDGVETYAITAATIQSRGDATVNNTDGDDISTYVLFGTMIRSL